MFFFFSVFCPSFSFRASSLSHISHVHYWLSTHNNKNRDEKSWSRRSCARKREAENNKNMRRMRSENLVNHSGFHLISLFGRCCCVTKYFLHHISVAWFWFCDGRGVNALPRTKQLWREFCGGKWGEFLSLFRSISGEEWWWDGSDEYLSIWENV